MESQATNPYQSPEAQLQTGGETYNTASYFSVSGRFNRMQYLAHYMALYGVIAVIGIIAAILVGATGTSKDGDLSMGLIAIGVIALIPLMIWGIFLQGKRLHDMNMSAWWILINFIPVVNYIFPIIMMVVPGTSGSNNFGAPPQPTKTWENVMGWLFIVMIIIALIGIVAALLIPALAS